MTPFKEKKQQRLGFFLATLSLLLASDVSVEASNNNLRRQRQGSDGASEGRPQRDLSSGGRNLNGGYLSSFENFDSERHLVAEQSCSPTVGCTDEYILGAFGSRTFSGDESGYFIREPVPCPTEFHPSFFVGDGAPAFVLQYCFTLTNNFSQQRIYTEPFNFGARGESTSNSGSFNPWTEGVGLVSSLQTPTPNLIWISEVPSQFNSPSMRSFQRDRPRVTIRNVGTGRRLFATSLPINESMATNIITNFGASDPYTGILVDQVWEEKTWYDYGY